MGALRRKSNIGELCLPLETREISQTEFEIPPPVMRIFPLGNVAAEL